MAKAVVLNAHIKSIADVVNERLRTVDPISVTTLDSFAGNVSVLLIYESRLKTTKEKADESDDKHERHSENVISASGKDEGRHGNSEGRRKSRRGGAVKP